MHPGSSSIRACKYAEAIRIRILFARVIGVQPFQ